MIQHFAASELCKITLQNEAAATDDDVGDEEGLCTLCILSH